MSSERFVLAVYTEADFERLTFMVNAYQESIDKSYKRYEVKTDRDSTRKPKPMPRSIHTMSLEDLLRPTPSAPKEPKQPRVTQKPRIIVQDTPSDV